MTIDEIFAALPEEPAQDAHEFLVIDPASRTIQVPEAESIFGVEGDEDGERKYFIAPRYVGDHVDLAACFLSIVYRNANGEKDQYLITDTAVNGEYVTFSWLISEKVVKYKGAVQFRFDADTAAGPAWGATMATGTSLEGLEPVTDTVEEETSDVVTQLRAMVAQQTTNVEAVGEAQVAAVNAQGTASTQEAVATIQAKGEAVLESIPEDYTALQAQADKLTRDRAAAIVCQAEGEALQITDASNDPLQGLRIFGKTKQHTTTGKNLWNNDGIFLGAPALMTKTKTGFMFNRGDNTLGTYASCAIPIFSGQTVTFSAAGASYTPTLLIYKDQIYGTQAASGSGKLTYTATEDMPAAVFAIIINSKDGSNVFSDIQVEYGTATTAWEPYSNGLASPSPEWPQELQSVQGPVVRVYGANLFDASKFNGKTQGGATLTNNGDGSLTVSGSGALTEIFSSLYSDTLLPNLLRPGKLTLVTGAATVPVFHLYAIDGNGQRIFTLNNGQSVDVTQEMIDAMTKVQFVCYAAAGVEITPGTIKPMLYQTGDGTWSAYKEPQALVITTPGSLPGIPVASGGNYTDENGQQWIADEVDLVRCVYVRRVKEITFDGTESWTLGDYDGTKYLLLPLGAPGITGGAAGDMCTHARRASWCAVSSLKGDDFFVSPHAFFSPIQAGIEYTSAADWQAYLAAQYAAGNPVKILYARANPVETPLTDVELQAYLALHSNKPTTTVLNDAGAHMVLEYAADPKTYIDNKLAALVAANN